LRAGKAVFVEKPLALDERQLDEIEEVVAETGNDRLMVGFNRRFAPLLVALRSAWGERVGPQVLHYRVNAGPVDGKSWYADTEREGGRFVGEGGHFIDTVSWWIGANPVEVSSARTPDDADNTVVTLRYPDGSVGVVSYLTAGDARYPKELLEVFGQGMVAKLDNFGRSELWRGGKPTVKRAFGAIDKGQRNELASFITAVRTGGAMPIALPSLIATTRATIAASRVPGAPDMRPRSAADGTVLEDVASVIVSRRPLEHEPAS
jgi:predicted dehydrogenase